ncbi:MAG: 50S ribosomal protein L15 [Mycoplasmataceae bacterium]|jgi:large subunit ribosomal protein L15|nr:50S ribosomal protein L15 [Mycoplasmataceae bacterium]
MKLNTLKYKYGSRGHKEKVAGRGFGSGSKRGFKGNKGQGQRATVNVRIGFEGGQTPLYRRVAKIGFNNHEFKNNYNVITLRQIETLGNELVNRKILEDARIIKKNKLPIKIIGSEIKLSKQYVFDVEKVTDGVKATIEKAGGKINIISNNMPKKVSKNK